MGEDPDKTRRSSSRGRRGRSSSKRGRQTASGPRRTQRREEFSPPPLPTAWAPGGGEAPSDGVGSEVGEVEVKGTGTEFDGRYSRSHTPVNNRAAWIRGDAAMYAGNDGRCCIGLRSEVAKGFCAVVTDATPETVVRHAKAAGSLALSCSVLDQATGQWGRREVQFSVDPGWPPLRVTIPAQYDLLAPGASGDYHHHQHCVQGGPPGWRQQSGPHCIVSSSDGYWVIAVLDDLLVIPKGTDPAAVACTVDPHLGSPPTPSTLWAVSNPRGTGWSEAPGIVAGPLVREGDNAEPVLKCFSEEMFGGTRLPTAAFDRHDSLVQDEPQQNPSSPATFEHCRRVSPVRRCPVVNYYEF